ncbi:MAG: hypothetical protein AAF715_21355 [Myxococcota bacterium]
MSERPSSALRALLRDAAVVARGSPVDLRRGRDLTHAAQHALESLVAWTGPGLPRIGPWDFGAIVEGKALDLDRTAPEHAVIARDDGGKKLLLRPRGSGVFAYDEGSVRARGFLPAALRATQLRLGMSRAAPSLLAFLERLALELLPCPPVGWWGTFLRPRDKRRAALARRLGVAASGAAEHYSDERFCITPDGIGIRDPAALPSLLAAARATEVELHVVPDAVPHHGADAAAAPPQPSSYLLEGDWASLSITTEEGLAEQVVTFADTVVERATFLDGEVEVERRPLAFPPSWWEQPVLAEYLQHRHVVTIDALRGGDTVSAFPAALQSTVAALDEQAGGLVAFDDLRPWRLIAVRPLVAPLHMAKVLAPEQFHRTVAGVPVWVVGDLGTVQHLALDEAGRWLRVHRFHDELVPAGDDVFTTLLDAALEARRQRRRHGRSLAIFFDDASLKSLETGLVRPLEDVLETWSCRHRSGTDVEVRTRKTELGSPWPTPHEVYVEDVDALLGVLERRPSKRLIRAIPDDQMFLSDRDLDRLAEAGLAGLRPDPDP